MHTATWVLGWEGFFEPTKQAWGHAGRDDARSRRRRGGGWGGGGKLVGWNDKVGTREEKRDTTLSPKGVGRDDEEVEQVEGHNPT
jgi:hypothetical protein